MHERRAISQGKRKRDKGQESEKIRPIGEKSRDNRSISPALFRVLRDLFRLPHRAPLHITCPYAYMTDYVCIHIIIVSSPVLTVLHHQASESSLNTR